MGKKKKGILPIVSTMPKDNHSVMQLYLDGFQNNFFTFFFVKDRETQKINNSRILFSQKFLKNKIYQTLSILKKSYRKCFYKKNTI